MKKLYIFFNDFSLKQIMKYVYVSGFNYDYYIKKTIYFKWLIIYTSGWNDYRIKWKSKIIKR